MVVRLLQAFLATWRMRYQSQSFSPHRESVHDLSTSCPRQVSLCLLICIRKMEKMTSSYCFNCDLNLATFVSPDSSLPPVHYTLFSSLPGAKYRPFPFPLTDLFVAFTNSLQQHCVKVVFFPSHDACFKALNFSLVVCV